VTGLQYLRARYYDPSLGRFNRPDPFAGVLSQPLTLHSYIYCQNNPLIYADPSGMLSLGYVGQLCVSAIKSILNRIEVFGYARAAKWAANAVFGSVVGWELYKAISSGPELDAYCVGAGGSYNIPKLQAGLAGGLEFVVGAHQHTVAVYGFGGGTTNNTSAGGYLGLVFNVDSSADYREWSTSVTLSPASLPKSAKDWLTTQMTTFLPRLQGAFAARSGVWGDIARSIDPALVGKVSQTIVSALSTGIEELGSVTFWQGSDDAFGFTISPDIVSWRSSASLSSSVTFYLQVQPWNLDVPF